MIWDKRDTFLMLRSVMQNTDISHNFQTSAGRWKSEKQYFDKVEFTRKVL